MENPWLVSRMFYNAISLQDQAIPAEAILMNSAKLMLNELLIQSITVSGASLAFIAADHSRKAIVESKIGFKEEIASFQCHYCVFLCRFCCISILYDSLALQKHLLGYFLFSQFFCAIIPLKGAFLLLNSQELPFRL